MTQGHADREQRSPPKSGPQASTDPFVRVPAVTWDAFSAGFDRCFGRVYAYVSRRVNDREYRERIASEVLAANLDLLVSRGDDMRALGQLKSSSDWLVGLESARSLAAGTTGP